MTRDSTPPGDRVLVEPDAGPNDLLRNDPTLHVLDIHPLVLEHLVVEKEALELLQAVWRELGDVSIVGVFGVVDVNGDDLVVLPLIVRHGEDADGPRAQDTEGDHRLLTEHEDVERIVVGTEGLRQEAIVRRIVHGAVQHSVQPQEPRPLVQLVLELGALGNLDDGSEVRLDMLAQFDVVPGMHAVHLPSARLPRSLYPENRGPTREALSARRQPRDGASTMRSNARPPRAGGRRWSGRW